MLADVPNFETANGFDYRITPTPQGWQLTVWEEAEVTEKRVGPFLWKFRVELPTLQQAKFILQAIVGQGKN